MLTLKCSRILTLQDSTNHFDWVSSPLRRMIVVIYVVRHMMIYLRFTNPNKNLSTESYMVGTTNDQQNCNWVGPCLQLKNLSLHKRLVSYTINIKRGWKILINSSFKCRNKYNLVDMFWINTSLLWSDFICWNSFLFCRLYVDYRNIS